MKPSLEEIEKELIELITSSIKHFAREHEHERFYGFGLDINITYGEILLCCNTEDDFKKVSQDYIEKWNYNDNDLKMLKLNFGDWKYQGFNLEEEAWQQWSAYAEKIEEYIMEADSEDTLIMEKFRNDFLKMCIEILLKLEQSEIFDSLNKEKDFILQVVEHDEDEAEAYKRFEEVKKNFLKEG